MACVTNTSRKKLTGAATRNSDEQSAKPPAVPASRRALTFEPEPQMAMRIAAKRKTAHNLVPPAIPNKKPQPRMRRRESVVASSVRRQCSATRQARTRNGSIKMVCADRTVPSDSAMMPVTTATCILERCRTRSPMSTTLHTATRSTKRLATGMAASVPTTEARAAKGSSHIVIIGGWMKAKSR